MRTLVAFLAILSIIPQAQAQRRITQADLLQRIIDLDRLTTPPPPAERTRMFSSYDRATKRGPDGNMRNPRANNDRGHYLETTDDGWNVMAKVDGPGAITRIWSANPEGSIRFELDGKTVIDTTFEKLLSGTLEPFTKPLVFRKRNCYFPIGFARSCRVLIRESTSYYQINVVEFPRGTAVESFAFELDAPAQDAFVAIRNAFRLGLSDQQLFGKQRMMPVAFYEELGPKDTMWDSLEGHGTVRALYVAVTDRTDPRELYALHKCILRIYVDGGRQPCVEAPLVDFFGSGFDIHRVGGLPAGTDKLLDLPLPDRSTGDDRFMYCHFPMPYQQNFDIEIENLGSDNKKIGLMLVMQVDTRRPSPDALRFHARFRKQDPCQVFDYPILECSGSGRLVGCVLNVDCPRAEAWGEGDHKIWIDGEQFPSYFGTGTPHYFGEAQRLHLFTHPLVGVTRTGPFGKSSAYRWHIPDVVNFQKSIRFTLENLQHDDQRDTYYSSIAYWYAKPGHTASFERLTIDDVTPPGLRIPGAVEAESTIISPDWGSVAKQKYARGVEYSGQQAANIVTTKPIEIMLPSADARQVVLKVRVNPKRSFKTITVKLPDGSLVGQAEYDREPTGIYTIGHLSLQAGNNRLIIQCSRTTTVDCWILQPVNTDETPATQSTPTPK